METTYRNAGHCLDTRSPLCLSSVPAQLKTLIIPQRQHDHECGISFSSPLLPIAEKRYSAGHTLCGVQRYEGTNTLIRAA